MHKLHENYTFELNEILIITVINALNQKLRLPAPVDIVNNQIFYTNGS